MIRLALELSLPEGSVAVEANGEIASLVKWNQPKRHAELVFSQIDRALKLAGVKLEEVEQILTSSGPGSFTGVRLSVTVGKSFKVLGKEVLSSTTLTALAFGFERLGFEPVPVIEARRGRFYTELGGELLDATAEEIEEKLKELKKPLIVYKGSPPPIRALSFKEELPLAVKLLKLPEGKLSPLTFNYVREHDAKPKDKGL